MIQGAILSTLSATCFGAMAVMAKAGYALGMDTWQMLLCRFVFGTLLMALWLLLRDPSAFRIPLKKLGAIALIGFFLYTAQSYCYFSSIKYIAPSTTTLILYAHPAVVTIFSALFLGLRLNRPLVISLIAVSLGCILVFSDAFARGADPRGLALATGGMAIFSCYLLLCQVMLKGVRPRTASFYMILTTCAGFCLLHPPTILLGLTPPQLAMGFAFGLIPTVLAVSLLYAAIERIGSAYAAVFSSFEPVATIIFAAIFLGDPLIPWQIAGTLFILAGLALPNLAAWRQARAVLRSTP